MVIAFSSALENSPVRGYGCLRCRNTDRGKEPAHLDHPQSPVLLCSASPTFHSVLLCSHISLGWNYEARGRATVEWTSQGGDGGIEVKSVEARRSGGTGRRSQEDSRRKNGICGLSNAPTPIYYIQLVQQVSAGKYTMRTQRGSDGEKEYPEAIPRYPLIPCVEWQSVETANQRPRLLGRT